MRRGFACAFIRMGERYAAAPAMLKVFNNWRRDVWVHVAELGCCELPGDRFSIPLFYMKQVAAAR